MPLVWRQGHGSGLGVKHLQQQLVEGDAAVAVQPQEGLHGLAGRLPQQGERHEQPTRPPLLPAGRLVFLQGLVQLVLEAVHRIWAVNRVSVWGRMPRPNVRARSSVQLLFRITAIFHSRYKCCLSDEVHLIANLWLKRLHVCTLLKPSRITQNCQFNSIQYNMKICVSVKLSQI